MVLCTVDYVRSKIFTKTLDDDDIESIIIETGEEILALAGTTDESNPQIILAGKYAIRAEVLRMMKTTGELAASVEYPDFRQQNTTDKDIENLEKKSQSIIDKFVNIRNSAYSSPSFTSGFGCHGGSR